MAQTPTWKESLTEAYPKFQTINPEKAQSELGFAMQIFQQSPYLQKCDPQSILNAVVNVARTSITLNPVMRLAYLIPRKNKCVLEFSYMGLVAMLRDNGCIKSISAHIVYEDEEFDYDVAFNSIKHKPNFAKTEKEHNSREMVGCYSRATLPIGEIVFEFMPMWEIDKIRSMSEGSGSKYSAWNTWRDEMIKKSVIKRHFKMLISGNPTEALATAMKVENDNNALMTFKKQQSSLLSGFEEETNENQEIPFFKEGRSCQNVIAHAMDETSLEMPKPTPMLMSDEEIEAELEKEVEKSQTSIFPESKNDK